jgi:glycosyltransferase involved in cell wall biosynthesis
MKIAIVHYWLVNMRGGEKVIEALCELFPQADIYTHVYCPENISGIIKKHKIFTTFIQKLPFACKIYQTYLPLMPLALEQLDLQSYDLVISSESGPAKGVITRPDALHICYCHSPMRYLWDMYPSYFQNAGRFTKIIMLALIPFLRIWDYSSAARVDYFVANSHFVARRIKKYYRREAEVIHPPLSTGDFSVSEIRDDYYLMVGQLVAYKRADVAVEAFNRCGKRLVIIGEGPQQAALKKAANANINFMGRQPFEVIKEHYSRCRALIFPGIEDFGIVPLEAMASGRPVIAFKKGGATESVIENKTGIFFDMQTPESLLDAVERFENIEHKFDPDIIRNHARKFDKAIYKDKFALFIRTLQSGL